MPNMLHLPGLLRVQVDAWAVAGYPQETCGLLLGRGVADGCEVVIARQARNLNDERAHDRYELDPQAFLAADREAREQGLEIVGVWHTHPDHPAEPSETDRRAAWPGWSYLILAVGQGGVRTARSWRLTGERFEEEEIES